MQVGPAPSEIEWYIKMLTCKSFPGAIPGSALGSASGRHRRRAPGDHPGQFADVGQPGQLAGAEADAEGPLHRDHELDVRQRIPALDVPGRRLRREDESVVLKRVPEDVGQALPDGGGVHGQYSSTRSMATPKGWYRPRS